MAVTQMFQEFPTASGLDNFLVFDFILFLN